MRPIWRSDRLFAQLQRRFVLIVDSQPCVEVQHAGRVMIGGAVVAHCAQHGHRACALTDESAPDVITAYADYAHVGAAIVVHQILGAVGEGVVDRLSVPFFDNDILALSSGYGIEQLIAYVI